MRCGCRHVTRYPTLKAHRIVESRGPEVRGLVGVGAVGEQRLNKLFAARQSCHVQRAPRTVVSRVGVRARKHQNFCDVDLSKSNHREKTSGCT